MNLTDAQRKFVLKFVSHSIPVQVSSGRSFWLSRRAAQIYASRRRVATVAAAVLAVGLGYHVVFGQNGLTAYQQKRINSVALDKELGRLGRENDLLKGHVDRLKNDPSAIEHQAREALHYARPDEVIYALPNAKSTGPN